MSLLFLMMFTVSVCAQDHTISRSSATKPQKTTDKSDGHKNPSTVIQQKKDRTTSKRLSCPDGNHPHMIDLGLPSGTKWACCNVGANKPEGYGGYYPWGEMESRSKYNWSTYIHCDGSEKTCHDLGSDIAGTRYDVAHVKWGGSWVMPSKEQQDELRNNCTYTWTTVNGVKGGRFTSKKNGKSIFLPAGGDRDDNDFSTTGMFGYYWSSSQYSSDTYHSNSFYFYSASTDWGYHYRYCGLSVRPVVRN